MNLKKCTFGVSAGQFLGFLVHEQGIEISLKSQEAVRTMVPPTTKREILSEPFMDLVKIKADEEFHWGAEQQRAFKEIKEYLVRPPILVPPQ
jgi:hypothetical protein